MGPSLSTLFTILMNEPMHPMKALSFTPQSIIPTKPKHFNKARRSFTNKNMRRNHQIKQPGFDVQRKNVTLGNNTHRKR